MPDQTTDLRCPACSRFLGVASADFDGAISLRCYRCKVRVSYPPEAMVEPDLLFCRCGKRIAQGVIISGYFQTVCRRDRAFVRLTPDGPQRVEDDGFRPPRKQEPALPSAVLFQRGVQQMNDLELARLVEERWNLVLLERSRRKAEVAVGLRFDVFNRDGFRCRYCGRGPDQGVTLEADHVIPRSVGGPDTLANLVTACRECNSGKQAKPLLTDA